MAQSNKRYFNTFFFEDPYVEDLDKVTRLLYLTMILNPHNNLAGCYEISLKKLMAYTGLSEDEVRIGVQKLQEDRKILFSGNWLALKNFIKNNELNPNMCKKAFDIMLATPKEKIIFIISDMAGNAEPWLEEFVVKIGKGINASIDSKNRNAISNAKKNNLPEPMPEPNQVFTLETFTNAILSVKKELTRGTLPPTLPPTLPFHKGEPSGEYKEEIEYEKEIEIEIEREEEEGNHPNPPFQPFTPMKKDVLLNNAIGKWNSKSNLPTCRYQSINLPKITDVIPKFDIFSDIEINQAIDNLDDLYLEIDPRYRVSSFSNFFANDVVDNFIDDAKPHDRYNKPIDKEKITHEEVMAIRRYYKIHNKEPKSMNELREFIDGEGNDE